MSEGDVSSIRDEDVLRRMWQQTEDFSRKKEIRAHMYRLREERLRNLYSPEPPVEGKGVEAARTHGKSFADQSFQRIKSKEVRDAASPPKEFTYRGQDLKELSNAGWNVESENRTTDDGHTRVRAVHANIEGKYDVDGGVGQFAATDHHKRAVTEYQDERSSLKRNETASNTAAHEQVLRKTADGAQLETNTSSSTSTSKFEQVSTKVPYEDNDRQDRETKLTNEKYEQTLRSDAGELVSRKIDYPDDNTKVIVETRCLPDGSRVTSTRREFRAPVQATRSEHSSRSESKSYSSTHKSDVKSSKIVREADTRDDIVDSQRHADDYDFKRNQIDYTNLRDDSTQVQRTNQTAETKRSDYKESSSKIIREVIDNRSVDSQSYVDDTVSKRSHQIDHSTQKYDNSNSTQQNNQQTDSVINEMKRETVIKRDNVVNEKFDHSTVKDDFSTQRTTRYETIGDGTDRRNVNDTQNTGDNTERVHITSADHNVDVTDRRNVNDSQRTWHNEERIQNITRDKKLEEVVERKIINDQYQTTYQNDYSQKKISQDLSPTHQAWASTLRADTPTSTRPTTRASSPGSRTYMSSTSSLRSSVSPDKTRKPPSRGGSPTKADRFSPSRSTSDRYSSTQSTHSVTESKYNRYTSPDRKPPSAPRLSSSPDRKPDGYRQRPSASPEKRSPTEDHSKNRSPRPSPSPERKPGYSSNLHQARTTSPYRPSASPDRKIFGNYPKDNSPTRQSSSPERKQGYPKPTGSSNAADKPRYQQPSPTRASPEMVPAKYPTASRTSVSPDRKPGYMLPTTASQPPADALSSFSPDRKSPSKYVPSPSPERKPYSKVSNMKEHHYRFIDEETKVFTREDINLPKGNSPDRFAANRNGSPSPMRKSPEDTIDHGRPESPSILRKASRSPSPPKGPVTFTQDQVDKTDKFSSNVNTKYDKYDVIQKPSVAKHEDSPIKQGPREPSPSKFSTYNKKHIEVEEITEFTTKDTENVTYDSLPRREKISNKIPGSPASPTKKSPRDSVSPAKSVSTHREPSPAKYGTYDKKRRSEEIEEVTTITETSEDTQFDSLTRRDKTSPRKIPDLPLSPTRKTPRQSTSPVKSPNKDAKYKHTTDFISNERTSEEIRKRSTTKDHPRQLVTPSSSPTRKPKQPNVETEPSTGQSSPTTSVSGFVYFGSPRNGQTIVTDLDDEEYFNATDVTEKVSTSFERPDTLNVDKSPESLSKIPCRSPSPEKHAVPAKSSLPRKSSLKKPSTDFPQISPIEKPPSNFRISPTEDVPVHKVVKKERPDKPIESSVKPKPPLERRETYEERCRKILGMMDDSNKTTVTKQTYLSEPQSNLSSPSVSPCRSPEPKESAFIGIVEKNDSKTNVTDFITREQEDTIKKTITRRDDVTIFGTPKTPSRDSSPTKLQDIISQKTVTKHDKITTQDTLKTTSVSPDREVGYGKPKDEKPKPDSSYPRTSPLRSSISPEKKLVEGKPRGASPVGFSDTPDKKPGYQRPTASLTRPTDFKEPSRPSLSPERKFASPTKSSPETKPSNQLPKESPTRSSVSPDRKPSYKKTTTATTTKVDETTTEDFCKNIILKKFSPSPDRETGYQRPKERSETEFSRGKSPSQPKTGPKPILSPERKPENQEPSAPSKLSHENKSPTRTSLSPDRKPGYMKSTATSTTKYAEVTNVTIDNKESETIIKSGEVKNQSPKSPQSCQRPSVRSDSPSKKPEESTYPRTPSPSKTVTKVTEHITDFIQSEREQEVLDRVQQSLRKLSPSRDQRSPSREKSPGKNTISLQAINVTTSETFETDNINIKEDLEITDKYTSTKSDITRPGKSKDDKPKEQRPSNKPASRNASPIKKPTAIVPSKPDKGPDSPTKTRSTSPKKPVSPTERPQSPQVPRGSGIKPREQIPSHLTRKPTPGNTSPTKLEKITTEAKKTTAVKQNSFTKTTTVKTTTSKVISPTQKSEPEPKRAPTPKGINKENVSPKKEETKVTRTPSDSAIKVNSKAKPTPQRMKSKPEIQVNDVSTTKTTRTTFTSKKSTIREPHSNLAPKPKSATALNTSTDDDDIIIDVELAKSSRENSPDRICPTPVGFMEEVGTPRFPDEVSEPDDEFAKRTHHIIHETESLVDDIVEICEDDELFVKKTDADYINKSDECLLSVTDKVSKFTNKIDTVNKPRDSASQFKNTERRVHSDFIDENLKSDECLLSVSEKVNKFAKGPRDTRDNRSPSRRIVDEYDNETIYQDNYTKLSVNDKAHLFVETAENVKAVKTKPAQKVERPDLSNVDESLKSDDCLLSVSDKVNKFVKTAEQFLTESQEVEEKDRKVREQYEKIMKHIVQDKNDDEDTYDAKNKVESEEIYDEPRKTPDDRKPSFAKETTSSHTKAKEYASPNLKPTEKTPTVKITTLRSSEAVKKAKALFENIASTTQKDTKVTKLTDIGVIKKSPKTDSTIVHHPSLEDGLPRSDVDSDVDAPHSPVTKDRPSSATLTRPNLPSRYDKPRNSPTRLTTQSPEVPRTRSPIRQTIETTTTKTVLSRFPAASTETTKHSRPDVDKQDKIPRSQEPKHAKPEPEADKTQDEVPSYQRPTKASQNKDDVKIVEEIEVSTRRGSGKFGVELRRTSVERSTVSSERRRSSEHHLPCIEDIFDLELLEQMLEKVVGYEQRRRIRSQIRIAKKKTDTTDSHTKTTRYTATKNKSPERRPLTKSPGPRSTPQKNTSPERQHKPTPQKTIPTEHITPKEHGKPLLNGHTKEPSNFSEKRQRPQSPEKPRSVPVNRSPARHPSPEKKTRTASPSKTVTKPKTNKFNEYASAYMKKVGLNETEKLKISDAKTTKATNIDNHKKEARTKATEFEDHQIVNQFEQKTEIKTTISKSFSERSSSKDTIEIVHLNGKRAPSPDKKRSPERPAHSPERLHQRTPSPDFKRRTINNKNETTRTVYETEPVVTKETITKTVYEERPKVEVTKKETVIKTSIEKAQPKVQEEKPSWVTNRNLKKITSENRTFSSKKVEAEKKYRAGSPSKAMSRPLDVITSSYGPGPLDADGRPLFGIKALRNGASNYQVKGTVIRQEFHSRNGSEPEGSVSVTAYSTEPEDLEQLLRVQGEQPSRIHGLAAITTTKKFGGDSGHTLREACSNEERASLEQFTHSDRRVDSRVIDLTDSDFETRNLITRSLDSKTPKPSRTLETKTIAKVSEIRHTDSKLSDVNTSRVSDGRESARVTEIKTSSARVADARDTDTKATRGSDTRDSARSADVKTTNRTTDTRSSEAKSTDRSSARREVRAEEKREAGGRRVEERRERAERREDRKTVRQSSVKSLTEKYIKSASDTSKSERSAYPKAGLILRTATMKDSFSSDSSQHAGLGRTDSEHSLASMEDTTVVTRTTHGDGHRSTTTTTTTTSKRGQERSTLDSQQRQERSFQDSNQRQERSFLDSSTKVTGVQDILTRMKNADIVIEDGDTTEDAEARALLNKFLGATVLMAGMQSYVADQPGAGARVRHQESRTTTTSASASSRSVEPLDLDHCWDERVLRNLLEESSDYEQRRRLRARIRTLMAEQEACASAVTEALAEATSGAAPEPDAESREEEEVSVTSSVRRNSSEKTVSSSTTTTTSKVIESMTRPAPKPVSPFAKFRQLEKQNSTTSPKM